MAFVVTLISVLTLGKPTPTLSLLLIGTARFFYTLSIWYLYRVSTRIFKYQRFLQLLLFLPICVALSLFLILINLLTNEITGSFYPPFNSVSNYSHDPFAYYFHFYSLRALIIGIFIFVIRNQDDLVNEKKKIQLLNEKLESQSLKMQLEVLRQQVNPHFLFNTLNSLRILIKKNPEEAERYTIELANVYRYLLNYHKSETVFLAEELDFIQSYLSLLKIRFGENLKVTMQVDQTDYKNKIVPLSLQILLENAVKHNSITKDAPLTISIFMKAPKLLAVENNLQMRIPEHAQSKFGLHHLNEQYRSYSGQEISITKTDKYFSVLLPLI